MTLALLFVILLVACGLVLIVFNGRKLLSDWPRPKPVHNVDLAWIQVYIGAALIVLAWIFATDPTRKLREPTSFTPTTEEARAAQQAGQAPDAQTTASQRGGGPQAAAR
jgi:hypothetical protein